jgi:hypothetical protein
MNEHLTCKRVLPLAFAYGVACFCFLIFVERLQYSTGVFLLLPVLVGAIQYGFLGGMCTAVLSGPLSIALFGLQRSWEFHLTSNAFVPVVFMIVVGATVGYISTLNRNFSESNRKLHLALQEVKTLSGLLPICANCKRIRDDRGYWNRVEEFFKKRTNLEFTHSICPECMRKLYPDVADEEDSAGPDDRRAPGEK